MLLDCAVDSVNEELMQAWLSSHSFRLGGIQKWKHE